jgi:hypothetical protein
MDAVYLDRICAVLDDMGVHHLRVAPEVDTVLVQLPEGFAGFQWYERFGYVLAIHSLHDTSDIPAEVRSGLIERWKAPGPPTGVLAVPGSEREVTPAYCLSSLGEDSTADEVRLEVRRLLGTAILALDELAELAGISTWEVGDTTVHAITDDWRP